MGNTAVAEIGRVAKTGKVGDCFMRIRQAKRQPVFKRDRDFSTNVTTAENALTRGDIDIAERCMDEADERLAELSVPPLDICRSPAPSHFQPAI